eukprot:SAG11_NODE_5311_length_1600_cov_0.996669_1_plen_90_part_10
MPAFIAAITHSLKQPKRSRRLHEQTLRLLLDVVEGLSTVGSSSIVRAELLRDHALVPSVVAMMTLPGLLFSEAVLNCRILAVRIVEELGR